MRFFNNFPLQRNNKLTDPNKLAQQMATLLSGGSSSGGSTSGGSVLVYNTLADLQSAYPGGTTQPAWVIGDNAWYYWSGAVVDTTPPTVTVSPSVGTYNTNQSVTLTANETSTIYYTVDGSTPTTSSAVYSSPISITATTTIKYFAKDTAGNSSSVQSVTYTIDKTAPTITASSSGGTFTSAQTVTLSSNETANIYYTLDGSTPTTSSTVYSSALKISSTSTLKFFGKDTAGNTSTVQTINFTITVPTPADVTNLSTSNISASSTTLTWTASANATSYDVYNGATLLGNTTNSTYQVTGLTASTAYTFKVIAKNAGGSSAGVTLNVTTLASAPNAVTNLTAGTVTSSSIPISWAYTNGSDAVANFEVAYSSNSGNSYTVASNVVNSSSTSYTVSGLSASTAYVIRVVAIDSSGNRSTAVTVNATTSAPADTTPPVVTASPAAGTYTSAQSVTLSATDNSGGAVTIYYTTDGTTPTTASTVYTAPISINATTTLQYIGKDSAGNVSTVQTATYTINVTPSVQIWDSFNRPNSTTGLGTADSGQSWVNETGVIGISNGATTVVTQGSPAENTVSYIDGGTSLKDNVTLSATVRTAGNYLAQRLIWNWQSTGNYYCIQMSSSGGLYFLKYSSGSMTQLTVTNPVTFTLANGDTLGVGISGSNFTFYHNGSVVGTGTDTSYASSGKFGLGGSACIFDDFQVAVTSQTDTTSPIVTATPTGGTYSSSQTVYLTSNEKSTIYYTTDGSTPTSSSSVFSTSIAISATETLKYYAVDSSGNASSVQSQTYTINLPVVNPITDNFQRADSATSLGTTTTGQSWVEGDGVIGIKTNATYTATTSTIGGDGACNTLAYVQSPSGLQDNITIKTHIKTAGSYLAQRIIWNFQSPGNYYCLQKSYNAGFVFFKYVNGSGTAIKDTMSTDTLASGDTISVAISGSTFNFYHNGTLIGTATDASYANNGKIGVGGTNPIFDQFKIWQTGTTEPTV